MAEQISPWIMQEHGCELEAFESEQEALDAAVAAVKGGSTMALVYMLTKVVTPDRRVRVKGVKANV